MADLRETYKDNSRALLAIRDAETRLATERLIHQTDEEVLYDDLTRRMARKIYEKDVWRAETRRARNNPVTRLVWRAGIPPVKVGRVVANLRLRFDRTLTQEAEFPPLHQLERLVASPERQNNPRVSLVVMEPESNQSGTSRSVPRLKQGYVTQIACAGKDRVETVNLATVDPANRSIAMRGKETTYFTDSITMILARFSTIDNS